MLKSLKDKFIQKWKSSHHSLNLMLMECWVNFCNSQNIPSQQNSVTVFSETTEVDGDLF